MCFGHAFLQAVRYMCSFSQQNAEKLPANRNWWHEEMVSLIPCVIAILRAEGNCKRNHELLPMDTYTTDHFHSTTSASYLGFEFARRYAAGEHQFHEIRRRKSRKNLRDQKLCTIWIQSNAKPGIFVLAKHYRTYQHVCLLMERMSNKDRERHQDISIYSGLKKGFSPEQRKENVPESCAWDKDDVIVLKPLGCWEFLSWNEDKLIIMNLYSEISSITWLRVCISLE